MQSQKQSLVIINARFLTQNITGVQRFAIEICLRLKDILPQVKFVAPKNILHKDLAAELNVETYGRFSGHLWEQIELPVYLKSLGNPLLVSLCNTAPVFYRRKVVCIHDLAFLINSKWFTKTFSSFYKLIVPAIAKSSIKVLTVSKYSKDTIIKYLGIPERDVFVLYNAVSASFAYEVDSIKNKYGNYILAVGSLDPRKNLKTLIKAYELCATAGLSLVIAGGESKIFKDPELQGMIKKNPSIIITGYLSQEELVNAYRHAKVFVFPSLFEGFGIPPLEAMSCGCATVVSNRSSLPEVCGEASLYIDPNNPSSIANAVLSILSNQELRLELIQKGFERCRQFKWESSAQKLACLVEEVA